MQCADCGAEVEATASSCPSCGDPFYDEVSPSDLREMRGRPLLRERVRAVPLAVLVLGVVLVAGVPFVLDGPLFSLPDAAFQARVAGWIVLASGALWLLASRDLFGDSER